jgi:hypothetical protein
MTSVIRHLLAIPNSLPSTSMFSDVAPKAHRRRQATLRKFARQNTETFTVIKHSWEAVIRRRV